MRGSLLERKISWPELEKTAAGLLIFQNVLDHPLGKAWRDLVQRLARQGELSDLLQAYGRYFRLLAEQQGSWATFLIQQIRWDDNPFSRLAATQSLDHIPSPLIQAAQHDLRCLQSLVATDQRLQEDLGSIGVEVWWPSEGQSADPSDPNAWDPWTMSAADWGMSLAGLADHYRRYGVGICAQFRAFRWRDHQLQGVKHVDPVDLDHLYGYPRQRQKLCLNTEALIARKPALHVLLYGARGTGKSSLVKSMLHHYGDQGLRLVEVNRSDLEELPAILEDLQDRPQSFIVFVDDLSFEADETDFKQLKVLLEGDIGAQPANVRLYATSNRRHLIREYFEDRPNSANTEVHAWDTVQEQLSLQDRFGLTLTFTPFTQADYLATVNQFAEQVGIDHSPAELNRLALIWAQQQNGFSGRTARQFISAIQAGLQESSLAF